MNFLMLTLLPVASVVTLAVLILLCFLRAMLCPKFADRLLAAHFAMTLVALLMAVLAFRTERGAVLALVACVCVAVSFLYTLISTNSERESIFLVSDTNSGTSSTTASTGSTKLSDKGGAGA